MTYRRRIDVVCARDKVGWGHPFQGDFYPWRMGLLCAGNKVYPRRICDYAPAIKGVIPGAYELMRQG
jgi:hypothetical protein